MKGDKPMFHVSVIAQRLTDGVPFCTICHHESLHRALRAFQVEFPNSEILSFHSCNIEGGNYEVRKHIITCNSQ